MSPNAQIGGNFGQGVAIDGITAVVGAFNEGSSSPQEGFVPAAGNVYLFNLQTDSPYLAFPAPDASYAGELGYAVAISGQTVVMGAPGDSAIAGDDSGVAYIL